MKIFNNKPRGYKHEMSRENHSMFSDERKFFNPQKFKKLILTSFNYLNFIFWRKVHWEISLVMKTIFRPHLEIFVCDWQVYLIEGNRQTHFFMDIERQHTHFFHFSLHAWHGKDKNNSKKTRNCTQVETFVPFSSIFHSITSIIQQNKSL